MTLQEPSQVDARAGFRSRTVPAMARYHIHVPRGGVVTPLPRSTTPPKRPSWPSSSITTPFRGASWIGARRRATPPSCCAGWSRAPAWPGGTSAASREGLTFAFYSLNLRGVSQRLRTRPSGPPSQKRGGVMSNLEFCRSRGARPRRRRSWRPEGDPPGPPRLPARPEGPHGRRAGLGARRRRGGPRDASSTRARSVEGATSAAQWRETVAAYERNAAAVDERLARLDDGGWEKKGRFLMGAAALGGHRRQLRCGLPLRRRPPPRTAQHLPAPDGGPGALDLRSVGRRPWTVRRRSGNPSPPGGRTMPATQVEKAERFQALHARPGAFVIPNPWDAGTCADPDEPRLRGRRHDERRPRLHPRPARRRRLRQPRRNAGQCQGDRRATDLPVAADLENGFGHTPERPPRRFAWRGTGAWSRRRIDRRRDGRSPPADLRLPRRPKSAWSRPPPGGPRLPFPFVLVGRARTSCMAVPISTTPSRGCRRSRPPGPTCCSPPGLTRPEQIRTVCCGGGASR